MEERRVKDLEETNKLEDDEQEGEEEAGGEETGKGNATSCREGVELHEQTDDSATPKCAKDTHRDQTQSGNSESDSSNQAEKSSASSEQNVVDEDKKSKPAVQVYTRKK